MYECNWFPSHSVHYTKAALAALLERLAATMCVRLQSAPKPKPCKSVWAGRELQPWPPCTLSSLPIAFLRSGAPIRLRSAGQSVCVYLPQLSIARYKMLQKCSFGPSRPAQARTRMTVRAAATPTSSALVQSTDYTNLGKSGKAPPCDALTANCRHAPGATTHSTCVNVPADLRVPVVGIGAWAWGDRSGYWGYGREYGIEESRAAYKVWACVAGVQRSAVGAPCLHGAHCTTHLCAAHMHVLTCACMHACAAGPVCIAACMRPRCVPSACSTSFSLRVCVDGMCTLGRPSGACTPLTRTHWAHLHAGRTRVAW